MRKFLILIAFLIFFIMMHLLFLGKKEPSKAIIEAQINNQIFKLEIAKSERERKIGLAGRESLCPDCGMFFILEEGINTFWMKDVKFDLDIIFLNKDLIILDIQSMKTCQEFCQVYQSPAETKYAIEINKSILERTILNKKVLLENLKN